MIKKLILSCFCIAGISNFSSINAYIVMVSTEDFQKIVKAGDVVIFSPVGHFGTKGQVQGSYYVAKNGVVFKSSSQYGFTFPSTVEVITGSFNEKS